jgi:A/G-specific adenine glycosylase
MLTPKEVEAFRATIYDLYTNQPRQFPWRETANPYCIWVSEVMLQQTQAPRVVPKYEAFLNTFPSVQDLAQADILTLLSLWQGLGYNRRALALQRAASVVVTEYSGVFPSTTEQLLQLPGIGPYTASAILAFAYNIPTSFIETNIRRVFIHFFFPDQEEVHDKQIMPLIAQTLDMKQPRHWYYALMDYGAYLAQILPNPNRRSRHYAKQSKFVGSNRQVRGGVLREIINQGSGSKEQLMQRLDVSPERLEPVLAQLVLEGFLIQESSNIYCLPTSPHADTLPI